VYKAAIAAALAAVYLAAFLHNPLQVEEPPSGQPVVQAILFYSPTCPHCHEVITGFLIPFHENNGNQLQVFGVDTSQPLGSELYGRAIERFEIPESRRGVPTLVVGDVVLVGDIEIPTQFPGIVEAGLASGGIGWPDIPDLAVAIPDLPPPAGPTSEPGVAEPTTAELAPSPQGAEPVMEPTTTGFGDNMTDQTAEETKEAPGTLSETSQPVGGLEHVNTEALSSERDIPSADPVGFTIAGLILLGMVAALAYTIWLIARQSPFSGLFAFGAVRLPWVVPALAFVGLGVSLYLSYVEVAQVKAVCGPVGECNIVQSSEYAQLLGIPIAVLGALSYVSVVVLWAGQRFLPALQSAISLTGLFALTIFCTFFSIYLTAIELFVIGAVCAWCLTSAVFSTFLMILVATTMTKRQSQTEVGRPTVAI